MSLIDTPVGPAPYLAGSEWAFCALKRPMPSEPAEFTLRDRVSSNAIRHDEMGRHPELLMLRIEFDAAGLYH
jgi:hypothetical protein